MDPAPNLDQALTEIAAIRGTLARAAEFRGYGPATLAATAAIALAAGAAQAHWLPRTASSPAAYVGLWSVAAVSAAGLIATEALARTRRLHRGLEDAMIRAAIGQFLPAAVAGLALTVALLHAAPAEAPLLPGLWQIVFSLGVFATARILPRAIVGVGIWYLASGLVGLARSGASPDCSPWAMAVPFAVGQGMVAAILWHTGRREPMPATMDATMGVTMDTTMEAIDEENYQA